MQAVHQCRDKENVQCIVDSEEICWTLGHQKYLVIGMKSVNQIARQKGIAVKEIEGLALMRGIIARHYLPMQAFGRSQIEVEKEMAFIH
jgi:hypothetical protein